MDGAIETPHRRRLHWTPCSALLIAALLAGPLAAAECRIDFDAHAPQRVELYTSEGCSSCPPADRWLAALPERGDRLLLALHVESTGYHGTIERHHFGPLTFARAVAGISDRLLRLSVGIETLDDILWDIDQALGRATA